MPIVEELSPQKADILLSPSEPVREITKIGWATVNKSSHTGGKIEDRPGRLWKYRAYLLAEPPYAINTLGHLFEIVPGPRVIRL